MLDHASQKRLQFDAICRDNFSLINDAKYAYADTWYVNSTPLRLCESSRCRTEKAILDPSMHSDHFSSWSRNCFFLVATYLHVRGRGEINYHHAIRIPLVLCDNKLVAATCQHLICWNFSFVEHVYWWNVKWTWWKKTSQIYRFSHLFTRNGFQQMKTEMIPSTEQQLLSDRKTWIENSSNINENGHRSTRK